MPITRANTIRGGVSYDPITGEEKGRVVRNDDTPGGSRRRRPSRKYKKSAKRVFRKKSRSTRRR